MYQRLLLFIFFYLANFTFGQTIDIGVYRSHHIQRVDFRSSVGTYNILADATFIGKLQASDYISISKSGSNVTLKLNDKTIGTYKKITLSPNESYNVLQLHPRSPMLYKREYNDGFHISSESKGLTIVNKVSYNHYLEGVIQSEGGRGQPIEYYKAQAVISRTYALKHNNRHQKDGFNLCDQVHCQAYYSRVTDSKNIELAVKETEGVYIIDTVNNELIESYFYANCGGETSRADYVWRIDLPYLKPVIDTFCIHTKQAKWTQKIPKEKWKNFLVKEYYYPIEDPYYAGIIYNFEQEDRKAFYISPHLGIPLRDLRYKFNLKSTFFSCYPEGNNVVIEGRGFGHGIGLCQEGAMNMAKQGYNYRQILHFYYNGIALKKHFEDLFFEQTPIDIIDF